MNLEDLDREVKEDIEDQSLDILAMVKDEILVIGGWAVRTHLGSGHHRYTLDVDGVAGPDSLRSVENQLKSLGLESDQDYDWGIRFHKQYVPSVSVPEAQRGLVSDLQLRVEVSLPRIKEHSTHHFYEFSLQEFEVREISYHQRQQAVVIRVPPIWSMAAVKLGLPVDYKHNHDIAMLLQRCDLDMVVRAIKSNDDWSEMVLRRMPKLKGRIQQTGQIENTLARLSGLDIKQHIKRLEQIEKMLQRKDL